MSLSAGPLCLRFGLHSHSRVQQDVQGPSRFNLILLRISWNQFGFKIYSQSSSETAKTGKQNAWTLVTKKIYEFYVKYVIICSKLRVK